jgi:Mg-chelatase subunit ChlD
MTEAEEADAKKTVLVVMTDGYENASKEHTQASIKAKVKQFEDKGWEVVFLGANFDAVESVSGSVGVMASKTMNIAAGNLRSAMDTLSAYTTAYSTTNASITFTAEDKFKATQPK